MKRAIVLAALLAVTAPAGLVAEAQTLTANPRAFRAYLRREIDKDLSKLYRRSTDLVEALAADASSERRRKADDYADDLIDLSHDIWKNLQMQKPTRDRPKLDRRSAVSRPIESARADAEEARRLVREVARDILRERRSAALDAKRRVGLLDKLERIELIGRQVLVDLQGRPR